MGEERVVEAKLKKNGEKEKSKEEQSDGGRTTERQLVKGAVEGS